MNLIIIGRNQPKLEEVQYQIMIDYKVQVEVIVIDFSHGPHVYPMAAEIMADKDIGILVNNVGVGFSRPKFFEEVSLPTQYISVL